MDNTSIYTTLPNLIIGFHGCDTETYKKVICGNESLKPSNNDYDWLGNGIYFWEQDLDRAWQWAESAQNRTKGDVKSPAVIGAVIDPGFCLNLLDDGCIAMLKNQYEIFRFSADIAKKPVPRNSNIGNSSDLLIRKLDCAVIENLHYQRRENDEQPFDSVRGVFLEGSPIYPTSGFMEHSHIQICVRNPNCIKGFFAPRDVDKSWSRTPKASLL